MRNRFLESLGVVALITPLSSAQCAWSGVGGGMSGPVEAMVTFDDGIMETLYAGGSFLFAGGMRVDGLARWDGNAWTPIPGGIASGSVNCLELFDNGTGMGKEIYVGGSFNMIGGVPAFNIARWITYVGFVPLGPGVNAPVNAMEVYDAGMGDRLYVGGGFTTAGPTMTNYIAEWNGTAWAPLGPGTNGPVHAIQTYNDGTGPALYVGGTFTQAAGLVATGCLAQWTPWAGWSSVGGGMGGPVPHVYAMTRFDDGSGPALIAGGSFAFAGSTPANCVAKWNGQSWQPLGAGMPAGSAVYALQVHNDWNSPALYAGGLFSFAGGAPANFIAKWDGATWNILHTGTNGAVRSLAVHNEGMGLGPQLYAGGVFTSAGGLPANYVARWNCPPCLPDINADRVLDFFDVQAFLQAFATHHPIADFTGDGSFDFFDVQRFLQLFAAGC